VVLPGSEPRTIRPVAPRRGPNEQILWASTIARAIVKSMRYFEIEELVPVVHLFHRRGFDGLLGPVWPSGCAFDRSGSGQGEAVKALAEEAAAKEAG